MRRNSLYNPLPKIYHSTYTLSKREGCILEEQDEGEPQGRFWKGARGNPGAITPAGGGL